jgi:hypothetical protein
MDNIICSKHTDRLARCVHQGINLHSARSENDEPLAQLLDVERP